MSYILTWMAHCIGGEKVGSFAMEVPAFYGNVFGQLVLSLDNLVDQRVAGHAMKLFVDEALAIQKK